MPWKETQIMDQRVEFALKSMNCPNFRALCRDYGISPKTGYKWKERFLARGMEGLADESRRPHTSPTELSEAMICELLRFKHAHPTWGARKILELYERKHGESLGKPPCETSVKRVFERVGLTVPRKRRKSCEGGRVSSGLVGDEPNRVWTVDFKGWWKDRRGLRVEPLTVRDEYSRMVLDVRLLANTQTETVQACFERLFERHGLPEAIRSDNGAPFASSRGLLGLSRLSAWWLALGIGLERGRPGRPQDNGAHERLHLDIYKELECKRAGGEQEAFDIWREEFNYVRPHEALGMRVPAEVYRPSERSYQGTPDELDYGSMKVRRVHSTLGTIRFQGADIRLSAALAGWTVGLAPTEDDRHLDVWFANLLLGQLDPETSSFAPAVTRVSKARQPEPEV